MDGKKDNLVLAVFAVCMLVILVLSLIINNGI